MPRLRGTFNTGSNLIQMYIDDVMRRGRAEYESQLMGQRQAEDDQRQFILNNLKGIVDGSISPEALGPSIQSRIGQYYDPTKMKPSVLRLASDLVPKDAKLPQDIPSNEALQLRLAGAQNQSGTENLPPEVVAAMEAERNRVAPFEPTTKVDFVTEGGDKMAQHFPNSQLSGLGALKQERTGIQEGQRAADVKLNSDLSPAVTNATISQTNAINRGTQQSTAALEGAKAGAQTRARLNEEFSPDILKKKFDAAKQIAEMEALLKRDEESLKQKREMESSLGSVIMIGTRIAELSDKVNTAEGWNLIERGMTGAAGMLGVDTDAGELNELSQAGALGLAQFLGNKGPVSEADMKAGLAFFPTAGLSKDRADRRKQNFLDLMEVAPFLNTNPQIPMAEKLNTAKQMIQQRRAQKGDTTPVDDPEDQTPAQVAPPAFPGRIIDPGR